ncbi:NADH-quinone oxidoreductase subunit C [Dongia sp.]|uniref:NADH-quinone oxidoreductase subunit C n=1 Tax=Dongia sp. TaxID=1977262 RepID=UPI0037520E17
MSDSLRELGDYIAGALGQAVIGTSVTLGELTVEVRPADIVKVSKFLRDDPNLLFKMLIDVAGVDYPEREKRFDVVYHLLSLKKNIRVRVRAKLGEEEAIASVNDIWPAAQWFEREAYDMYGIFFSDNPDLRRILTDYGFEGHPFRKDFPLTGYIEVRYDEAQKRVIYEPVELRQEFRSFDFLSPWEGMLQPRVLPGDEKATPGPKDPAPANPAPGAASPSPTANSTNNPGASGAPKAP